MLSTWNGCGVLGGSVGGQQNTNCRSSATFMISTKQSFYVFRMCIGEEGKGVEQWVTWPRIQTQIDLSGSLGVDLDKLKCLSEQNLETESRTKL